MARKRLQQSTADYLAIALSPVLIMLLVGSLVFFLQEVSYGGAYQGRVRWVLGWFVFATVLISRIGIELGKSLASMYGGALALACVLFVSRILDEYLIGTVILMGVTWWCVNKLTWDCTYIDENDDASGAGLLQQSGMDQPPPEDDEPQPAETQKQRRRRLRREQLLAKSTSAEQADAKPDPDEVNLPEKEKQHAPGVWVVYFSLAALPLFGIGQAFLPSDDGAVREGFIFLWIYVASALGLFLTTSFLGLRRYLRQRKIKMPVRITAAWVTSGAVIVFVVLGLCLLIPRPHSGTSVTALLDRFVDDQAASDVALSGDDAGEGDGRRAGRVDEDSDAPGNKTSEDGQPTDADGEGNKSGESDRTGKTEGGDQQQDDQQDGNNTDQQTAENERNNDDQNGGPRNDENQQQAQGDNRQQDQTHRSSETSSAMSKLAEPLKWLLYLIFGCLIAWGLWKNRHNLAAGAREFLQSLADFWANLFQRQPKRKKKTKSEETPEPIDTGPPPKRFAEYDNPFRTGEARRMRPDALVLYTEEAFRAYGRELGVDDGEEITTAEFGEDVSARVPELSQSIRFLAAAHSRILYSSHPPTSFDVSPLETLWTGMTRREPQAVG